MIVFPLCGKMQQLQEQNGTRNHLKKHKDIGGRGKKKKNKEKNQKTSSSIAVFVTQTNTGTTCKRREVQQGMQSAKERLQSKFLPDISPKNTANSGTDYIVIVQCNPKEPAVVQGYL